MDGSLSRLGHGIRAARTWWSSPRGKRTQCAVSLAASAIILFVLVRAIVRIGWQPLVAALPASALFWSLFIGSYLLQPLIDWQIFRHWWRLQARDIAVFLKRRVMNEALFSYAGDGYLMVWASTRLGVAIDPADPAAQLAGRGDGPGVDPAAQPIAAIKDVAITSGLAGNLSTLLMLGLALLLGADTVIDAGLDPALVRRVGIGFALLVSLSLLILLNRGKAFSLPVGANVRAFWWHLLRLLGSQALLVASWVVALPAVAAITWVQFGALRMVMTRMPLPNKEILFAGIAISLAGDASTAIAALMAAQGALHLVSHGIAWAAAAAIDRAPPRVAG
ncbi:hypothetical protein [Sandarakinorhabdus sp. DWP1-3-1]|uniref:hypothetical protein n=1 Tax=Sandarakinorhabdus sp. DWP1-3-1 TaxID=2804627 RepID=UPI003CFAF5E6